MTTNIQADAMKQEMLVNKLRAVLGRMEIATMLSSDAMVWTNERGKIQWCNGAFEDLINQPRYEILGSSLLSLLPLYQNGQLVDPKEHPVYTVLKHQEHRVGEYTLQQGEKGIDVEISQAPTHGASEDPESAVLVLRRQQELIKQQLPKDMIDTAVADRMRQLMQENEALKKEVASLKAPQTGPLQQKEDPFEGGYRAKTAFLANMTHEFRTPLSAIMGYTDLLHNDVVASGYGDWANDLDEIKKASNQLFFMVNQLLDLSALEEDKSSLRVNKLLIDDLVKDVESVAQSDIAEQKNTLVVQVDENADSITTDGSKLRKILLNLLNNASKFTVEGTISLNISRLERNGVDGILFAVHDTGIGMHEDQVSHIFEPFTQVDESMTREYEGGGIGLYICKRFCELMKGEIWVKSQLGKGSMFSFFLPLAIEAELEA